MAGTLSATITVPAAALPIAAAFGGSGAFDIATMTPVVGIAAGLAGSGALVAPVYRRAAISAALSGSGVLTAVDSQKYAPAPAFAGSGALSATVAVGNVALSVIGTATVSATTSVALPAHAVGDLIVIAAARSSNTPATKPAASGTVPAWVDIDAGSTSAGQGSMHTAHFVATATNHTSGTWTGANSMCAIVLRGQAAVPIGGHAQVGGTIASFNINGAAITLTKTDGSSMLLYLYGSNNAGVAWPAAPSGYTRRVSGLSAGFDICLNTKNSTTSDGAQIQACNGTNGAGCVGATIEILD